MFSRENTLFKISYLFCFHVKTKQALQTQDL